MSDLAVDGRPTPAGLALAVLAIAIATIAGAWFIQLVLGVLPCQLCLEQRIPYYVGIPVAALTFWQALRQPRGLVTTGLLVATGAVFAVGGLMGLYHAGVEWGLWPGPTDCTGPLTAAPSMNDFMKQLGTTKVIRCDEVPMRIFGLSLAAWNMIVATALAIVAFAGARQAFANR
jgi:disulfide bond formation protein DsbB